MANDEEEERDLEQQLQFQIKEQKDSLTFVSDAISADPSNSELLSVHSELVQAIKDAEEGLFHLKKARLLREADAALNVSPSPDTSNALPSEPTDVEPEPLKDDTESRYSVGSKCRFRYTDGRWYNGLVVELEGSEYAKISFLTPTSESMLMCKFFLQQRCRFGSSCRLSHGIDIPISSLKKYIPTTWDQSLVGSSIWAVSDKASGIWREAELNSWDDALKIGEVVFCDDGSSENLSSEAIVLSEYAEMSEEESEDMSSDQSGSSSDLDEVSQGLGFFESAKTQGVQKETAIFAKWENHTRGIASKMMANMGYREGMGLGASGQGMLNPIPVRVLKPKQSLDDAVKNIENQEQKDENRLRKRTRGGKRLRDKKLAAAVKAAEEDEESKDVFSLINTQLAMHGQRAGYAKKKQENKVNGETRRALLAHDDEINSLKLQVGRLEEMVKRNRKEKLVFEAATRKLEETRKALADAEEARASTSSAVARKDKEKKWLKF